MLTTQHEFLNLNICLFHLCKTKQMLKHTKGCKIIKYCFYLKTKIKKCELGLIETADFSKWYQPYNLSDLIFYWKIYIT